MGEAGCADVEHRVDRAGASGKFPSGKGWEQFTDAVIEAVNAQDRPIVFALGTSGAAEGFDVDEPAAFDFEGAASESLVCISRIFRLQAFQPDQ